MLSYSLSCCNKSWGSVDEARRRSNGAKRRNNKIARGKLKASLRAEVNAS